jgi:hypothetical protein
MHLYLYIALELICTGLAIRYYAALRYFKLAGLLPFLLLISLAEMLAIWQKEVLQVSTYGTNYGVALVELFFYSFLFMRFTSHRFLKRMIRWLLPVLLFILLVGYWFYTTRYLAFFYSLIIEGFFLTACALGYLYFQFEEDRVEHPSLDPVGWIAIGVMIFFSGISIVFSLYEFIRSQQIVIGGEQIYNLIPRILSIVLYSCISMAIITCKTNFTSSSAS